MAAPCGDDEIEDDNSFFENLTNISPDPPYMRDICDTCRRPAKVCWCEYLPRPPPDVNTKVYILQHPFEESRRLQTAPMLFHGLPPGHCHIFKGKRFSLKRLIDFLPVLEAPNTLLLYPGPQAQNLEEIAHHQVPGEHHSYNIVLLDGTWPQAGALFWQNKFLHKLKQVQLGNPGVSEYVVRTQPTDGSLSTLETAAAAIAVLENKPHVRELLVRPLRAMCKFQLAYGAVAHHSKEYQIANGTYFKQSQIKDNKLNSECPEPEVTINNSIGPPESPELNIQNGHHKMNDIYTPSLPS